MKLIQTTSPSVLLTPQQMGDADRMTIDSGVSGMTLMKNAGYAVAREIKLHWTKRPVLVLCGPGNNGGDGFIIARELEAAGWSVVVALTCDLENLRGDAAQAAALWGKGDLAPVAVASLEQAELVVDAVYGAGLNRDFDGPAAAVLNAAEAKGLPIVAVDVPSGLDGATGEVRGYAPAAALTVTFFRMKPGHKLLPGRDLCGLLVVADIGILPGVCSPIAPQNWVNQPGLWRLPRPEASSHKYTRGHVLMVGGHMTGAIRLACRAARRVGAGLVSIICPISTFAIYAADAPGAIVIPNDDESDSAFCAALSDGRKNVVVIGPGHGLDVDGGTTLLRRRVLDVLKAGRGCVLDADAISAFADMPQVLFEAIKTPENTKVILTPHAGEFARLFPDLKGGRLANVRQAAARSGAIVVLKGADTIIAAPDGTALINDNAPPTLATAGAGDVLAGLIAGLLAQGMEALEAAAAGVWIHGDAARQFGPGLIAEDIPDMVPQSLRGLLETAP